MSGFERKPGTGGGEEAPVARRPGRRLLIAAALWLACGKGIPSRAGEDTNGLGPAGASSSSTKGTTQMSSTSRDIELIRSVVAGEFHINPDDVKVTASTVAVPSITVFTASVNPAAAGRHATRSGIVQGGTIYREVDAMSRVARAWSYGVKRSVPPDSVADVFGQLYRANDQTAAMLGGLTLKVFKQNATPKQAAAAQLPSETIVDGLPAVVFCLTSSQRSIPFTIVTAIVKPDFSVELRTQPVLSD